MDARTYIDQYLQDVEKIINLIDKASIEQMLAVLLKAKQSGGRVFVLGVGGGAGNAAHLVNDLRKIAAIEAYAPTDSVSELTARINDDGWNSVFAAWLKTSRLNKNDCIFVLSVGGGDVNKNVSINIVHALTFARDVGAQIIGIVGRDGGFTAQVADAVVIIPTVNKEGVTAYTESFQSVIGHLLITHPLLKTFAMKWESLK